MDAVRMCTVMMPCITDLQSPILPIFRMPGKDCRGLERLRNTVQSIGARPVVMSPEDHDRAMARVSHLPQLLSTALATVTEMPDLEISGSGLRDMMRLAGSGFEVWQGILRTNADNIDLALDGMIRRLQQLRAKLAAEGLEDDFARAQDFYQRMRAKR